ncbi:MAG: polyhydroxybutyrate depolymerase [Patescibacteria group bacterium]|nr:polyhydroxybutyrate depolymerase [Patescibacteria group bacterium]
MKALLWSLVSLAAIGTIAVSLFVLRPFGGDTQGNGGGTPKENPVASSGKQTFHIEEDGVQREFIVYRPENLSVDEEVPVVYMFHGSGQSGEIFYKDSGWVDQADAGGFMVVFPTALKYHVFSEEKVVKGQVKNDVAVYQSKWNSYELASLLDPKYPGQELADDMDFTRDMVAFVNDNYATDTSRIYATGFSNGASFTSRLAVEATDIFAAFAPTSAGRIIDGVLAAVAEDDGESFTPRPVIQVIGSLDPKLTHAAEVEEFTTDESANTDGDAIKESYISGWIALEGLEDSYTYESISGSGHFTYADSTTGADNEYQLYVIDGMKHVYPNGENFRFDVTDVYWDFFKQYSL